MVSGQGDRRGDGARVSTAPRYCLDETRDRCPAGGCGAQHGRVRAASLRDRPVVGDALPRTEPGRFDHPGRDRVDRRAVGLLAAGGGLGGHPDPRDYRPQTLRGLSSSRIWDARRPQTDGRGSAAHGRQTGGNVDLRPACAERELGSDGSSSRRGSAPHLTEPNAGGGPRIAPLETLCTARLPSAVKDHSAPSTNEWRTFQPADLGHRTDRPTGHAPSPPQGAGWQRSTGLSASSAFDPEQRRVPLSPGRQPPRKAR